MIFKDTKFPKKMWRTAFGPVLLIESCVVWKLHSAHFTGLFTFVFVTWAIGFNKVQLLQSPRKLFKSSFSPILWYSALSISGKWGESTSSILPLAVLAGACGAYTQEQSRRFGILSAFVLHLHFYVTVVHKMNVKIVV